MPSLRGRPESSSITCSSLLAASEPSGLRLRLGDVGNLGSLAGIARLAMHDKEIRERLAGHFDVAPACLASRSFIHIAGSEFRQSVRWAFARKDASAGNVTSRTEFAERLPTKWRKRSKPGPEMKRWTAQTVWPGARAGRR
jgi:hypothetical protein